jgi:hypothetical protein
MTIEVQKNWNAKIWLPWEVKGIPSMNDAVSMMLSKIQDDQRNDPTFVTEEFESKNRKCKKSLYEKVEKKVKRRPEIRRRNKYKVKFEITIGRDPFFWKPKKGKEENIIEEKVVDFITEICTQVNEQEEERKERRNQEESEEKGKKLLSSQDDKFFLKEEEKEKKESDKIPGSEFSDEIFGDMHL